MSAFIQKSYSSAKKAISFPTIRHSCHVVYYTSTKENKYNFHIVRYKKSLCYLASDSFGVSLLVGTSDLTSTGASVSGWLPLSSAGESSDMVASINVIALTGRRVPCHESIVLYKLLTAQHVDYRTNESLYYTMLDVSVIIKYLYIYLDKQGQTLKKILFLRAYPLLTLWNGQLGPKMIAKTIALRVW